ESIWLGGNDLSNPGLWVWASGAQRMYPFVNWHTGNELKGQQDSEHCLSTLEGKTRSGVPGTARNKENYLRK
ncbi:Ctype lectin domain family 4 member Klike, partial [Caligus rogercresseyi]